MNGRRADETGAIKIMGGPRMETAVSVIVPIYNVEKYLDRCIESILGQTFSDFELILVDDGSPDRCPQICDEWAKKDERIRVIHKENGGLADARNCGIAGAVGRYTTFVDSDDWVESEFLEVLYKGAVEHNADVVQCNFQRVYSNKTILQTSEPDIYDVHKIRTALLQEMANDKLLKMSNSRWNKLYETGVLKKAMYLTDTAIAMGEDFLLNFAVFGYCKKIVVLDTKPLYNYLFNEESISSRYKARNKFDSSLFYENLEKIAKVHGCYQDNKDYLRNQKLVLYIYECAISTWSHREKKQEIWELISMIDRKYWLRAIGSYEWFAQRVCAALTYWGWVDLTLWLVDVMKKIKGIE